MELLNQFFTTKSVRIVIALESPQLRSMFSSLKVCRISGKLVRYALIINLPKIGLISMPLEQNSLIILE